MRSQASWSGKLGVMSSERQENLAELREHYSQLLQCRGQVRQPLTRQRLDVLGREMAEFIAAYRAEHEVGPTRRDLRDALDLPDQAEPSPPDAAGRAAPVLARGLVDSLFAGLRWRGWITYTAQARSLDQGPRGRKYTSRAAGQSKNLDPSARAV